MLVRLNSSTSGELVLFAEHARRLYEIIGKERTARGVFTLQQLPEAIARLRQAVADEKAASARAASAPPAKPSAERAKAGDDDGPDEADDAVSLGQRAYPLIRLLERTLKEGGFVLWEAAGDF